MYFMAGAFVGVLTFVSALCVFAPTTYAATTMANKHLGKAGRSEVHRLVDNEAGVVCFVVPQDFCNGDCAYSPAISCLKIQ